VTSISPRTLRSLADALAKGELSAVEVTSGALARAAATSDLGAYLRLDAEGALAAAVAADTRRAKGERRGPLDGLPLALKDNLLTLGLETTAGSRILSGFVPPYDATVVRRLREAGAVILGKTSMDEFGFGSSTEHCAFKVAKNPWDMRRTPGGSSGGSALAVASGTAYGALGTDTGGSVRQPAAFCGLVGLRPTYGRVSRFGVIAFASSMDQVGPLTHDVADNALLFAAIAGHDPHDATSVDAELPDLDEKLERGVAGLELGVPREYFGDGIDAEVRRDVEQAIRGFASLGARIVDVTLPHTEVAVAAYQVLATAEGASNLARYDSVRFGARATVQGDFEEMLAATRGTLLGREVKRRIMLGTFVLSAGYYDAHFARAAKVRALIREELVTALENVDALVTPTSPIAAFALGERLDEPVQMYGADVFTVGASLAGLPALSVPCGLTRGGLPIGLQLIGRAWGEADLFCIARALERAQDWRTVRA